MSDYNFKKIENNWKDKWYEDNIYRAEDFSEKPKKYILAEFPYPSGKSMHVGHMMRYTMPDIYTRYLRMKGYNVMYPMGWDAFGLPAENYAVKTGVHPAKTTEELVGFYRQSMKDMGYGIDWEREVNTTDPDYYKWTQWIFLRFWEQGLAELREEPVWWSPKMKTVLAEEEVEKDKDGNLVAERDGSEVERKMLKQWVLKIPEYADKLLEGLENIDFPESVRSAQSNWIGRSEGAVVKFPIVHLEGEFLKTFTTRVDTSYGITFIVIAPEHEIMGKLLPMVGNRKEVQEYIDQTSQKTDLERQQLKEKTGVRLEGVFVKNPFDDSVEIPVYTADYVIATYGTGIVMGVPGHDERDFEFANKYGLDIIPVISEEKGVVPKIDKNYQCSEEYGYVVNSGEYDGMTSEDAKKKMTEWLKERDLGYSEINYSIRDWIFSRQRYWGEPIPLIHKEDGTIEAVAITTDPNSFDKKLPLELPDVPDFNPTDDGSSPLAANIDWVNTKASDGTPAKRETNTMPNWAGSCWYFLRYIDPKNDKALADMEKLKYWLPVDKYFGGSEHTTLHLLYSRFWHRFLYDQGVVPTPEPYQWRMNGGVLLGPDGKRMSKSRGNVVEPQEILQKYGADAVRMYIVFIGPYDGTFPYNETSLKACHRVLSNIDQLRFKVDKDLEDKELEKAMHNMIKKVSEMAEDLKMNTIVSEIMIFTKLLKERKAIPESIWRDFIKVLAPISPFLAEDLWQEINGFSSWKSANSVHLQLWPEYDPDLIQEEVIEIPVQINGKMRGTIEIDIGVEESKVEELVKDDERFNKYFSDGSYKKFIYIPEKIVNIVV